MIEFFKLPYFSSKLVVTERDVVSSECPGGEDQCPEKCPDQSADNPPEHSPDKSPDPGMLQSVVLTSPQESVSSLEIISPGSDPVLELSSPGSTVEVISPEPAMESLKISVSSDQTVTTEQQIGEIEVTTEQGMEMEAELQEAMVESGKKSSESGESSDMVRVEMTSDTTSSDIEVIRRNSEVSGGHTRNSSDQSSLGQLEVDSLEDLRRRNKELSDILAAREGRLVAVSREIIQVLFQKIDYFYFSKKLKYFPLRYKRKAGT